MCHSMPADCVIIPLESREESSMESRTCSGSTIKFCKCFVLIFLVFSTTAIAWPLGVTVRFVGYPIDNLELGKEYSLPMVVTNTSKLSRNIAMRVEKPVNPKDGYESLPELNLIKVMPDKFNLKSGGSVSCEVKLVIPKDEKYNKRNYEAIIISKALPDEFFGGLALGVEVESSVRFTIGGMCPETLNKIKKNFELQPSTLSVRGIRLGKNINIKQSNGETLKITNRGNEEVTLKWTSVEWKKKFSLPAGCEIPPGLNYLEIKNSEIKLEAGDTKEVNLAIKFPKNPDYKNKKYAFLVKGETIGTGIPIEIYAIVVVETK